MRFYHPVDNFQRWWQEAIKKLNRSIIVAISSVSLQLKVNTVKCYMKKDMAMCYPKGERIPSRARPGIASIA